MEFKKAVELAAFENGIELQSELNNYTGWLTFSPMFEYSIIDASGKERYQICNEMEVDLVCENRKDFDGFDCISFFYENEEYFFVNQ